MGTYLIKNVDVCVADSIYIKGEKALVAQNDIDENTVLFMFQGEATDKRTRTSIQVSADKHVEPGDFGAYTNHSCSPNAQIVAEYDEKKNIAQIVLMTIKPIKKGEEVTFDYATTESTVTEDLHNKKCLCHSPNCRGVITGFNDLPLKDKMELFTKGLAASYLQIEEHE